MDRPSTKVLIFRASVAEPWGIITAIHTRDPEKDLCMKGQTETASRKIARLQDCKGNKPENIRDRHHPHLPHPVPRGAECPPAGQAKVLNIHSDRILLQAEIRLAELNTRMPGVVPVSPPVSTVRNLPVTVSWIPLS